MADEGLSKLKRTLNLWHWYTSAASLPIKVGTGSGHVGTAPTHGRG